MKKRKSPKYVLGGIVLAGLLGTSYWLGLQHASDTNHPASSPLSSALDMPEIQGEDLPEMDSESTDDQEVLRDSDVQKETVVQPAPEPKKSVDPFNPIRYRTYSQGRWGYTFRCPAFLSPKESSSNSDGQIFEDQRGIKLITYGGWNVMGEHIGELYRKNPSDVREVTYRKLFKDKKFYVKSGYTNDNRIFYMKEAIIGKSDEEAIVTLMLYYPRSYEKRMAPVISEIFPRFPL